MTNGPRQQFFKRNSVIVCTEHGVPKYGRGRFSSQLSNFFLVVLSLQ